MLHGHEGHDSTCEVCAMKRLGSEGVVDARPPAPRSLGFIFNPRAVAVIGASENRQKVGYAVMNNIITSGYEGEIYPVNIRSPTILGRTAYKSVLDIPGEVDVVVIAIPARFVIATMEQVGEKGIRGAVIITAGFREIGGAGVELEAELIAVARKHNIRVIGPNCLGFISRYLNASFASKHPPKGHIAMISQSGAMMTAILDWSVNNNIGFSNFVSIGNKSDLDEVDLIKDCGEDPETRIVIVYIESVTDGAKMLRVLPEVTKRKPVIILKSGVSERGRAAAASHTGALAQNDIMFDAAFRKCGVIRAAKMVDLFDLARCFSDLVRPRGDKFVIVTNAGGPSIVATDAFVKNGVGLSTITDEYKAAMGERLTAEAALGNPIDIIGDATPDRYEFALRTLLRMPHEECAGALVLVTPQSQTNCPEVANVLLKIQAEFPEKTILASFMGGPTMDSPKEILMGSSIPVYDFPESAINALKYVVDYQKQVMAVPVVPERLTSLSDAQRSYISSMFQSARRDDRKILYSYETSAIFEIYGIKAPKTVLAETVDDLDDGCDAIGFPVVLKIVSPDILHKSDCGGVVLNVQSLEEAKLKFAEMMVSLEKYYADHETKPRVKGVEIQEMICFDDYKKTHKLIVGVSRDPTFGPLLMCGQGGKYANFIKDVAFDLVTEDYSLADAESQLRKTKIFEILEGVRGERPSAIRETLECMKRVAELVSDFDEIMELDVNPLLVFQDDEGINAVDIKITFDPEVCFGSL